MNDCVSKGLLTCARPDFCAQPSQTGMCRAYFPRFYFNTESNNCESFVYGGCQGNLNNFETSEECNSACAGLRYCNSNVPCPEKIVCDDGGLCIPTQNRH